MQPDSKNLSTKLDAALARSGDVLKVALVKALQQVQANPSTENIRNHQVAQKSWDDYQKKQQLIQNPTEVTFKTVAEAYRYALDNGYRRTRQTMDNHIAAGYLMRQTDGGITKPALDAYLAMQAGAGDGVLSPAQELEIRDQAAKTKKTEAQAEVWDIRARKDRGELIERAEIESLLAQRAQFLRQDLESFFRVLAPDIIALVNGDEGRVFDLTEFGLDKLEEYLDRYSKPMPMAEVYKVSPQETTTVSDRDQAQE